MGAGEILGIIFIAFGSVFIALSFGKQCWATHTSKNTVSLNLTMFLIHSFVSLFFAVSSIAMIVSKSNEAGECAKFCLLTLLNLSLTSACVYMCWLKIKNKQEADALGISELDHFNNHLKVARITEE